MIDSKITRHKIKEKIKRLLNFDVYDVLTIRIPVLTLQRMRLLTTKTRKEFFYAVAMSFVVFTMEQIALFLQRPLEVKDMMRYFLYMHLYRFKLCEVVFKGRPMIFMDSLPKIYKYLSLKNMDEKEEIEFLQFLVAEEKNRSFVFESGDLDSYFEKFILSRKKVK